MGAPAVITTGPPDPLLTIVNRVVTGARGSKRELTLHRGLGADTLEIHGTIPLEDRGYRPASAFRIPALLFVYLLALFVGPTWSYLYRKIANRSSACLRATAPAAIKTY